MPSKPSKPSKPKGRTGEHSVFLDIHALSELTSFTPRTIYNQHNSGKGVLVPILTKMGGRLGAWRQDFEAWVQTQRKFRPADDQQRPAA